MENLKDIIRQTTGKENPTRHDITTFMYNRGINFKDARQMGRAYERLNKKGRDIVLRDNNTFDILEDGKPLTGTGRNKGQSVDFSLGNVIGVGREFSKLAGGFAKVAEEQKEQETARVRSGLDGESTVDVIGTQPVKDDVFALREFINPSLVKPTGAPAKAGGAGTKTPATDTTDEEKQAELLKNLSDQNTLLNNALANDVSNKTPVADDQLSPLYKHKGRINLDLKLGKISQEEADAALAELETLENIDLSKTGGVGQLVGGFGKELDEAGDIIDDVSAIVLGQSGVPNSALLTNLSRMEHSSYYNDALRDLQGIRSGRLDPDFDQNKDAKGGEGIPLLGYSSLPKVNSLVKQSLAGNIASRLNSMGEGFKNLRSNPIIGRPVRAIDDFFGLSDDAAKANKDKLLKSIINDPYMTKAEKIKALETNKFDNKVFKKSTFRPKASHPPETDAQKLAKTAKGLKPETTVDNSLKEALETVKKQRANIKRSMTNAEKKKP